MLRGSLLGNRRIDGDYRLTAGGLVLPRIGSQSPLQLWRQATGLIWTHLWLGTNTPDLISGVSLVQGGSAQAGVSVTGLKGNLTSVAYQTSAGSTDAWAAASNTVGEITADTVVCVLFRTTAGLPAASRNLVCKRDATSPNSGYEINLETTGNLTLGADNGPTSRFAVIAANHADNAWHVVAIRETIAGTLSAIVSDLGSNTQPGSGPAVAPAIPLTIGRRRLNAGALQYAAWAVTSGAEASSVNLSTLVANIKAAFLT